MTVIPETENERKAAPKRNQLSVGLNFLYCFVDISVLLYMMLGPFLHDFAIEKYQQLCTGWRWQEKKKLFFYLFLELAVLSVYKTDLLSSQLQTYNSSQCICDKIMSLRQLQQFLYGKVI